MAELKKSADKDEKISSEDYEQLLDKYQFSASEVSTGKVVRGRVIKVTAQSVLVDIGFKSEGVIPVEEFEEAEVKALKPGDEIEATMERNDAKEGYLVLSKKGADTIRAIDQLDKAYATRGWVTGKVKERTRGGFTVNVGIDAFLPESHADIRMVREPDKLVGQTFKFKVIKFDRKTENAVLSRKLYLQDEREKKKKRVFSHLVKGERLKGQVRSLTSFGAFVDIGGIEGLLHVSDMSWGKIAHPSELFSVGQEVEVVVLDFNEKDEKISLGYQAAHRRPLENRPAEIRRGPEGQRPGGQPDRFRRLRRAREGRRGTGPHLRPDLVPEARPSQEAPHGRRRGHGHHPGRQPRHQEDLPGAQAVVAPSPGAAPPEILPGRARQGQDHEHHGFRRFPGGRARDRGAHPHLGHHLGEDQASLGAPRRSARRPRPSSSTSTSTNRRSRSASSSSAATSGRISSPARRSATSLR